MACCCDGLREPRRHFGQGRRSVGTNFGAPLYFSKDSLLSGIAPVAITISVSAPFGIDYEQGSMNWRRVSFRALSGGVVELDSGWPL